ncbi:MAG: hypothetical protein GX638_14875 [Crenarchaeota archaeon]|nr:hypothetical protein [Thermoproteota archaeon]
MSNNVMEDGQKATEVKMVDRPTFKQIEDALSLVKSIANRKVSISEDFMQIVGEDNLLWNIICDALDATRWRDPEEEDNNV